MKTIAIRAFVVALAVAGFGASSMYSAATARDSQAKMVVVGHPGIVGAGGGGCAPGRTACGMD